MNQEVPQERVWSNKTHLPKNTKFALSCTSNTNIHTIKLAAEIKILKIYTAFISKLKLDIYK